MAKRKDDSFRHAVERALYYISRGKELPEGSKILSLAVVAHRLRAEGRPDNHEQRQEIVRGLLKEAVEYFSQKPTAHGKDEGHDAKLVQLMIDTVYSDLGAHVFAERTYDRLHVEMIDEITRWLREHVPRHDPDALHLPVSVRAADAEARDIAGWLADNPSSPGLVACNRLTRYAALISDADYHVRAQPYLELAMSRLRAWPINDFALWTLAQATGKLAHGEMIQGLLGKSAEHFQMQRDLGRALGDVSLEVDGWHMLGVAYSTGPDPTVAWDMLMEAQGRTIAKRGRLPSYEYRYRLAWIQRDLVSAATRALRFGDVPRLAKESLTLRERLADWRGIPMTWEAWGRALTTEGQQTGEVAKFEAARVRLEEASKSIGALRSRLMHTMLHATWAELYQALGDRCASLHHARQAESLAITHGYWDQWRRVQQLFQS